ncbi:SpoIIE family protein phosphatase [Simiduia aestuariiviva]|uniref:Serine phosphatase RsbU (Regulator of sigma subunit) n=1 Tax=Simiduia aestuariiviva TaxID=1510459 RepID=A0A839UUC4_9GAMM|nr:SpoIIE family protein phosphatase [Simiduia aestuariiviva]MBB3168977.1 serine phosphatase RsbU (regulator of sigma subunit) [Simiduia aestuariiviva]
MHNAESRRRLLIIDDDTIVRQSIVVYLADSGFDVLEASNGQQGLDLFFQEKPDIVLTDLRMPGIDGLQVLGQIHEVCPDTPVMVISGAGVVTDVVEALRLGASDYMIKPVVDMEMLVHSIDKSLERQALLAENQRYRQELEAANRNLREHLRVLERDQQAGRQVQRRLLPQYPQTRGEYHIAHHIEPSLFLSGDFIDYAYLGQRYLAFYLADVSGHGASSAFVTVWLKHLVTRLVREEGLFADAGSFEQGPAELLSVINRELLDTALGHHLTLFTGVIDTDTNQLRYSVAGHLPMPVMIDEDGAHFMPGEGKAVGIFKEATWQVWCADLPPQFSLFAFSDGVLEVLEADNLADKEVELLSRLGNMPRTVEAVCQALNLDQVEDAPDDIAVLSISRGLAGA